MNLELSDEQHLLRETVRDFARPRGRTGGGRARSDQVLPLRLIAQMGELGLMGIPFPHEYGGGGADTLSYVLGG